MEYVFCFVTIYKPKPFLAKYLVDMCITATCTRCGKICHVNLMAQCDHRRSDYQADHPESTIAKQRKFFFFFSEFYVQFAWETPDNERHVATPLQMNRAIENVSQPRPCRLVLRNTNEIWTHIYLSSSFLILKIKKKFKLKTPWSTSVFFYGMRRTLARGVPPEVNI